MHLIVGLGNPGPKYEYTRHNVGFLVLDRIAAEAGIRFEASKFSGEVGRGQVMGKDCILLKPMTFMNRSGESVAQVARFYKIDVRQIAVVHDDIDLPEGKVKSRLGGGHGGHNGIRSMIDRLGDPGFFRVKVGFGKPEGATAEMISSWVLGRMTDAELAHLEAEVMAEVEERLKGFLRNSAVISGV